MNKWIPITERLPKSGQFVLVSFENRPFPDIARYEGDEEGGTFYFYSGCETRSYLSYGFFVNAWMPLPKPYRELNDLEG